MFFTINVCCVYSLESPHRGDSNEYTQHDEAILMSTYSIQIKEENLPKLSVYRIWRNSLRTQERVRLIHGKRAIGVRAIEVLLYHRANDYNHCRGLYNHKRKRHGSSDRIADVCTPVWISTARQKTDCIIPWRIYSAVNLEQQANYRPGYTENEIQSRI